MHIDPFLDYKNQKNAQFRLSCIPPFKPQLANALPRPALLTITST